MVQWYAIVWRSGPRAGEAKSFGTVITGDDPDGPSFDNVTYEKIPIDHPPGLNETWDRVTKAVVTKPSIPKTRRQELKEQTTWTVADRNEAIKLLL